MFALLILSVLLLAVPSTAQLADERDITAPAATSSCPSTGLATTDVPEDGFTDVPPDNVHEFAIDCLAWYGMTSGKSDNTYDPGGRVRRDQMASFIVHLLDYVADEDHAGPEGPGQALPPVPAESLFPCDVDRSNVHYESIHRLAAAGIVEGTGPNANGAPCFNPGGTVSRAQTATIVREAEGYTDNTRTAVFDVDFFVDDNGDTHEEAINVIASFGIARGTGTNPNGEPLYSPGADVKRDQMASFLARTLDLLVEDGATVPPSTSG